MAALGFQPDTPLQRDTFALWPENTAPVAVFARAITQWHVGPSGAIGLRYEALELPRRAEGVTDADWPEVFASVQTMEHEALRLWSNTR